MHTNHAHTLTQTRITHIHARNYTPPHHTYRPMHYYHTTFYYCPIHTTLYYRPNHNTLYYRPYHTLQEGDGHVVAGARGMMRYRRNRATTLEAAGSGTLGQQAVIAGGGSGKNWHQGDPNMQAMYQAGGGGSSRGSGAQQAVQLRKVS